MNFTKIQDYLTHKITQYRIDGKRVSANKFNETVIQLSVIENKRYNSSITTRLKNGDFKHSFNLN